MAEAYQYYGLEQTRGLENYNNTCWLNSVLQCLAQTPLFYDELCSAVRESRNSLEIPGGTLTLNGATIVLPQLEIEFDHPGALTYCLYMTLRSLANADINTYYPYRFLQSIGSCLPQFIIGEHNDSHEFVRCLLETLRTEKQEKYRQAISQGIKIIKETNPEFCTEEDEDQITNFYCLKASERFPSPLEKYFRGSLQTSLQCVHCKTVTYRKEEFFDLSVPIAESNILNYTNMESASDEKNEARHIRFMHVVNANQAELVESQSDQSISILLYYSLLHRKLLNNYKIIMKNLSTNESSVSTAVEITNENEESKIDDEAVVNNAMEIDCLDVKNENNQISEFAAEQEDQIQIQETKIEISDVDLKNINIEEISNLLDSKFESPMEETKFYIVAVTKENQINNISAGFEECSNDSATKGEIPEATSTNNHEVGIDNKPIEEVDWNDLEESDAKQSNENKDSMKYVEDYCFLKTCLDNFFGEELLTDDNKVICEECSNQSDGNGKKVLRDTLTSFKISSAPHILILHLKRFNFLNGEILKNNKKVLFPTILDMAPFCTAELDIQNDGVPLLYSLYAVNEHFGTMEMGHYVSYRRLETDNSEYAFDHTLPGQWIITNDENVNYISENNVTNVRAYILFYKRIF